MPGFDIYYKTEDGREKVARETLWSYDERDNTLHFMNNGEEIKIPMGNLITMKCRMGEKGKEG